MRKGADLVVPAIAALVKFWPQESLYYLKYKNYPGSLFTKHLDWHKFMTSDQISLVPEVYVEGAPVFDHFGYHPPPELMATLKKYKTVGICGLDTDACVMAAVFALWDAEIRPIILSEYCASSGGVQFHQAALDLMLRQFGAQSVLRGKIQGAA